VTPPGEPSKSTSKTDGLPPASSVTGGLPPALLAMEDGTIYRGFGFGAEADGAGEIVFNTAITGYQEVITDPPTAGRS